MEGFEFDVGVLALSGAWEDRHADEFAVLGHLQNLLSWTSLSMENSMIASTNQDLLKFAHEVLDELQSLDLSEQMVPPFCKLFSLLIMHADTASQFLKFRPATSDAVHVLTTALLDRRYQQHARVIQVALSLLILHVSTSFVPRSPLQSHVQSALNAFGTHELIVSASKGSLKDISLHLGLLDAQRMFDLFSDFRFLASIGCMLPHLLVINPSDRKLRRILRGCVHLLGSNCDSRPELLLLCISSIHGMTLDSDLHDKLFNESNVCEFMRLCAQLTFTHVSPLSPSDSGYWTNRVIGCRWLQNWTSSNWNWNWNWNGNWDGNPSERIHLQEEEEEEEEEEERRKKRGKGEGDGDGGDDQSSKMAVSMSQSDETCRITLVDAVSTAMNIWWAHAKSSGEAMCTLQAGMILDILSFVLSADRTWESLNDVSTVVEFWEYVAQTRMPLSSRIVDVGGALLMGLRIRPWSWGPSFLHAFSEFFRNNPSNLKEAWHDSTPVMTTDVLLRSLVQLLSDRQMHEMGPALVELVFILAEVGIVSHSEIAHAFSAFRDLVGLVESRRDELGEAGKEKLTTPQQKRSEGRKGEEGNGYTHCDDDMDSLYEKMVYLSLEYRDMEEKMHQCSENANALRHERDALMRRVADLSVSKDQLQREKDALQGHYSSWMSEKERLEGIVPRLESKIRSQKEEMEEMRRKISDLESIRDTIRKHVM
eukprot:TRINITY_DN737_c0_g3_i1.p1 TRINITY_DN737_c0_g3~~TRINITY_DN737_c0_g3_i1.p1  ORF type:complete len:738 (+),score=202.43 TRINITY_DN737_c0_g3_i1:93-2216(+)